MRRKSVWKQKTIAYLAAVSLAVGMIPVSLPTADAYADETDVAETAVLEADVQQTDEQEAVSGQEADKQEADVKEAEQEADEQEADVEEAEQEAEEQETQPEAEESDDSIIAAEQAIQTAEWYDWLYVESEKIYNTDTEKYPEVKGGPNVEKPKIKKYNTSEYIENFTSTIYDITPETGVGGLGEKRPTVLFGTFETEKGKSYRFSFDYLVRWWREQGVWTLSDPEDDDINTFDIYVYSGSLEVKERATLATLDDEDVNSKLQEELNGILDSSDCEKMGTYMGQYQDWSHDVFSFKATGSKTTIIFKPRKNHNCGALVTNMKLEETGKDYTQSNQAKASDPNNLVKNGVCDENEGGWGPHRDGSVSYTEGNGGTGIDLNKDGNGVSQDLTVPLVKGDKIEYAFDIKGSDLGDEEQNTVEVYLQCGDEPPVKLTTVKAKDGEWQTVSGFYNIEDGTPKDYKIILQPKKNTGDNGAVIDNVSVMRTNAAPAGDLNEQKKKAEDAIDGMENLPDDKKQEHKDNIGNAKNPEQVIEELKKAAEEELEAKADKAKEDIDKIDDSKLGNADKDKYKDDVDDAKTDAKDEVNKPTTNTVDKVLEEVKKGKDEIDKAADEAKKKAGDQTSVDKDKEEAKGSVDDMKELTDKEKEDAKDKIDEAAKKDDKDGIRDALKDAAKKEIDNTADKAKKETDALPNLTQDEKKKVKDDIDKAAEDAKDKIQNSDTVKEIKDATDKGVKDINDIVDNAKKKDGKDAIDKMDNLSKDEKDKYKDELDKADTEDKVNQIIKDASKKDLDNQAKDAKDKIDKSDFLTDAEKDDLKKKVDAAAEDAKKKIDAAKNPAEIKKAADDGKTAINLIVNWTVNLTKEEINIWKNSQSLESVENSILNTNTDKKENKGSNFSKLRLKGIGQKKAIKLKWKRQSGADGYIIYGSPCGKKMKKLKTINNGKTTTWTQKKRKKGTYYKYKVVAYKTIAGQKRVIAQSIGVHSITNGGKYLNPTKVILKSKKKITLKKGKSTKIKATYNNKKRVKNHISVLRFESSNTAVATVGYKTGKVKAKKPGKCTIFVYLQNGYYKTVKLTVK